MSDDNKIRLAIIIICFLYFFLSYETASKCIILAGFCFAAYANIVKKVK